MIIKNNIFTWNELRSMDSVDVDDVKTAYLQRQSNPEVIIAVLVRPRSCKYMDTTSNHWKRMFVNDYGKTWRCFKSYPTKQDLCSNWIGG